jgi:flagellar M-ring protein FliF
MDFLNQSYKQIFDLFASMTPASRLMAALLAGVIVVGLVYLFQVQSPSADDYLLGGRPFLASELTAVQRALSEAGLKNWELEGNRIKIPGGQKAAYIAALAEGNALPIDWNSALDKAVDGANPFRSRHEIDLTMQRAKQKELALVISRFRNVEQASVMFDEVEKGGLRRQKLKTASVAVQTSGTGLEQEQVRAIRNLLATSYAGLDRNSITITDATTGVSYAAPGVDGEGGENIYAATKAQYEDHWKKKILDRLAMVQGVHVGVNVEMDGDLLTDTTTVKIDSKTVPVEVSETTLESNSSTAGTQGRPGAVSNGVAAIGNQPAEVSSASGGAKSSQNQTTSTQRSVPGYEQKHEKVAGMRPKHVTVSIDVPQSYFSKIWRQAHPTPAGETPKEPDIGELKKIETEERKRIEDAVVNLLPPPPAGKPPYPLVTVTSYVDLPGPSPVATPVLTQATDWLSGNWRTLAMFGFGLFGLVALRGMLRAAPQSRPIESQAEKPQEKEPEEEPTTAESTKPEPILVMRRKLSSKGPNLKEELRQLVKDDPDAAANVLRGWIGDAA